MCVMSMIMDHKFDEWNKRYYEPTTPFVWPVVIPIPPLPWVKSPVPVPMPPTQEELDEFRRLLERGREYDKKHNQPDCELEEKRTKLKRMAEELGVKIDFV